jgi:RimJ/RimL family protein N-acetyltransferase
VAPDNAPSQAIIRKLGFEFRGQQIDEIDGPEDIFELSAEEYRARFVEQ